MRCSRLVSMVALLARWARDARRCSLRNLVTPQRALLATRLATGIAVSARRTRDLRAGNALMAWGALDTVCANAVGSSRTRLALPEIRFVGVLVACASSADAISRGIGCNQLVLARKTRRVSYTRKRSLRSLKLPGITRAAVCIR